jgi:hypothetical protein
MWQECLQAYKSPESFIVKTVVVQSLQKQLLAIPQGYENDIIGILLTHGHTAPTSSAGCWADKGPSLFYT